MQQSPSWEANWFSASEEIPYILWNPILSHSTPPQPTFWRSILILSCHLRLGLPNVLFPSGFRTKSLYASPLPHSRYMPRQSHDSRFYDIVGEQYRSLSSSLCSFLHSPVTSSLLGSNILLSTLFSNPLSLRSSLNVSDQVSHSNKTGRIIYKYILYIHSIP